MTVVKKCVVDGITHEIGEVLEVDKFTRNRLKSQNLADDVRV